jgi:hypothetical protein
MTDRLAPTAARTHSGLLAPVLSVRGGKTEPIPSVRATATTEYRIALSTTVPFILAAFGFSPGMVGEGPRAGERQAHLTLVRPQANSFVPGAFGVWVWCAV